MLFFFEVGFYTLGCRYLLSQLFNQVICQKKRN